MSEPCKQMGLELLGVGAVWAAESERGVVYLQLGAGRDRFHRQLGRLGLTPIDGRPRWLPQLANWLEEYTHRGIWDDRLPLDIRGTDFQQAVWTATRAIPVGETRSYKEIAQVIGRPRAARAVGNALGANRLPLLIPCHRVLATGGGLGGFTGGLNMKRRLLATEGLTALQLALSE